MLNIKPQSSPSTDRVNNGDNSEVVIGNGNNNNEGKNSKKPILPSPSEKGGRKLNPWFITGFADAEGCFHISILNNKRSKENNYNVRSYFQISLHKKDLYLLELFKNSLGVGSVYKVYDKFIQFRVSSIKDLQIIIDHFNQYPLATQKRANFELFKQVFDLIKNQEHLTNEGLRRLLAIKAAMNRGLSESLNSEFSDIIPVARPQVLDQSIPNAEWVAGFTSGEGCYYVKVTSSKSHKIGSQVQVRFSIGQHNRDEKLIQSFIEYFGSLYKNSLPLSSNKNTKGIKIYKSKDSVQIQITNLSEITKTIIPFFEEHPLVGSKVKDYEDFKQVVKLMESGEHLTLEGLNKIKQIKLGMNRGRE